MAKIGVDKEFPDLSITAFEMSLNRINEEFEEHNRRLKKVEAMKRAGKYVPIEEEMKTVTMLDSILSPSELKSNR